MLDLLRVESCKLLRKKIPPDKVLESCLERATNLDRAWGKKQAMIRGFKLMECKRDLAAAQVELEKSLQDSLLESISLDCQQTLREMEPMLLKWIKSGDRCTKIQFNSCKSRRGTLELKGLYDEDNVLKTDWDDMARIATSFYSSLLTSKHSPSEAELLRVLVKVQVRISKEDRALLEAELTLDEIHAATKALGNFSTILASCGSAAVECLEIGYYPGAFQEFSERYYHSSKEEGR